MPQGAKQAAEKLGICGEISRKHSSAAKVEADSIGFVPGMNPRPTARMSFSAACKASIDSDGFMRGLNPLPPSDVRFPQPVKPRTSLELLRYE